MREADDGDDARARVVERFRGEDHVGRLDAVVTDSPTEDDLHAGQDVDLPRFGLEDRMVDQSGQLAASHRPRRRTPPRACRGCRGWRTWWLSASARTRFQP